MTKRDLVLRVARDTKATKAMAARAVASALASIARALARGEAVTLVGFGTFRTAVRRARIARNPLTGARIKVKRRKAVRFVAGKALRRAVN